MTSKSINRRALAKGVAWMAPARRHPSQPALHGALT